MENKLYTIDMKKIQLILLLVLAFTGRVAFAQTLDVEWGGASKMGKDFRYLKIAGQDKDKYYLVRYTKTLPLEQSPVWIESVSKTTNSIEMSYPFNAPEVFTKKTSFENLFYFDGQLIVFVSFNDVAKQRKTLYAMKIQEDGTPKSEPMIIASIPWTGVEKGFTYSLTADQKNVLVYWSNDFSVYGGEPLNFKMINANLELAENQQFELPFIKRKLKIERMERGKSGNYYFAISMEPEKQRKTSARAGQEPIVSNEYLILVWNVTKKAFQQYPIQVEKYAVRTITFGLDDEENMIIMGFGTKRNAAAPIAVYYQKLIPRFEKFIAKTAKDFSKDRNFINEFKDPRNGTTDKERYAYQNGQIVFLQSAGCVFLSEHYYATSRVMVEPRTKVETLINYYNYNDIMAVNVSEENEIGWVTKVAKKQFSTDDKGYYSSYYVTVDNNKTKLFFNDNSKNVGKVPYAKIKEATFYLATAPSETAVVATIYADGNVDRVPLFQKTEARLNICPAMIIQKENQYYIYGQDKNEVKFGNFFFE